TAPPTSPPTASSRTPGRSEGQDQATGEPTGPGGGPPGPAWFPSVQDRDVHVVVVAQGRVAVARVGGVPVGVPAAAAGPDAPIEDHVLDVQGPGVGHR